MEALLSLVSALHLACVLFAAAAPCYALWLEWQGARQNDLLANRLGRSLALGAIYALLIGMTLGGLSLLVLYLAGQTPYFEGLAIIPLRRIWFSAAELVVYLAGMTAYVVWWQTMPRWLHRFLAVFSATHLLYHFPPLFSAVAVASTRPPLWGQTLEYTETLSLFGAQETLARTLHAVLASFAIAGVALVWLAQRRLPPAPTSEAPNSDDSDAMASSAAASWIRRGGKAALLFTLLQIPMGIWLIFAMPG